MEMGRERERESKKRYDILLMSKRKYNKKLPKYYSILDCTIPKI